MYFEFNFIDWLWVKINELNCFSQTVNREIDNEIEEELSDLSYEPLPLIPVAGLSTIYGFYSLAKLSEEQHKRQARPEDDFRDLKLIINH